MKRRAFTLIELLVVIAIIAILAAILFPVFAKAREKARQITCTSDAKQIGLGVLQYVQDYDENYPTGEEGSLGQGWAGTIYPYVKSGAVFHCPDDPTTQTSDGTYTYYPVSFAANLNITRRDISGQGQQMSVLSAPASTVYMSEVQGIYADVSSPTEANKDNIVSAVNNGAASGSLYPFANGNGNGGNVDTGCLGGLDCTAYVKYGQYQEGFEALTGRHTDGSIFLLCDGHAKWLRGAAVSGGFNATAQDCNQNGTGTVADCPANSGMAAGTGNGQFTATFSTN
jgi:prepilin-type N-terminal cleavage/methylation domain-containing protein/prepilin-type processing-associated H-X9-DG protein